MTPIVAENEITAQGAVWDRTKYAYANGNPLRFVDPSGRDPIGGPLTRAGIPSLHVGSARDRLGRLRRQFDPLGVCGDAACFHVADSGDELTARMAGSARSLPLRLRFSDGRPGPFFNSALERRYRAELATREKRLDELTSLFVESARVHANPDVMAVGALQRKLAQADLIAEFRTQVGGPSGFSVPPPIDFVGDPRELIRTQARYLMFITQQEIDETRAAIDRLTANIERLEALRGRSRR